MQPVQLSVYVKWAGVDSHPIKRGAVKCTALVCPPSESQAWYSRSNNSRLWSVSCKDLRIVTSTSMILDSWGAMWKLSISSFHQTWSERGHCIPLSCTVGAHCWTVTSTRGTEMQTQLLQHLTPSYQPLLHKPSYTDARRPLSPLKRRCLQWSRRVIVLISCHKHCQYRPSD